MTHERVNKMENRSIDNMHIEVQHDEKLEKIILKNYRDIEDSVKRSITDVPED